MCIRYSVIPIIGDGALTGGMAMEALNQIGSEKRNMIIIFNDNNMSISQNVGAMKGNFTKLRTSTSYTNLKEDLSGALSSSKVGQEILEKLRNVKNSLRDNVVDTSIFGEVNLDYIGPVNGHDFSSLLRVLKLAKKHNGPIVIHVVTQKGKGYSFAEEDKEGHWHGVPPFCIQKGEFLSKTPKDEKSWSQIVSDALIDLAKENKDIVTLTPAMIGGSKLHDFFQQYPERSFDCGIAEEHAMTFAAGLAQSGKRPFLSIYSSFLQRAYDQVNHDVSRMDLPVVLGIDRCGLVGEDGDTHHGVFDISFLRTLPNMILAQGKDANETRSLLYTAFMQSHPFALRYPRGNVAYGKKDYQIIPIGTWSLYSIKEKSKGFVITYGPEVDHILHKCKEEDLAISVINARFFKPLDTAMLEKIMGLQLPIIVFETDIRNGGLSSAILEYCNDHGFSSSCIERIGIQDHFVGHG
ncbi:MAG: 1-deoxy-D-xylulose-5-phosphate synthase, partial [Erysipelotrichaceae bacterium]|nr:1-deoxy-D-xylulose-5-phosphate synthase [Erysipelotrichaceae bacterium]